MKTTFSQSQLAVLTQAIAEAKARTPEPPKRIVVDNTATIPAACGTQCCLYHDKRGGCVLTFAQRQTCDIHTDLRSEFEDRREDKRALANPARADVVCTLVGAATGAAAVGMLWTVYSLTH